MFPSISIFKGSADSSVIDKHAKEVESKGGKIKQRYDSEIMKVCAVAELAGFHVPQRTLWSNCNELVRVNTRQANLFPSYHVALSSPPSAPYPY